MTHSEVRKQAEELMRSAWAMRRESFDAEPEARRSALNSAREKLVEAAEKCRHAELPVLYAQALHLGANVELDLGNSRSAEALWKQAIGILRTTDEDLQLAHKVRHLGDLHRAREEWEEALACYEEALAIYRAGGAGDRAGTLDFANAVRRMADLKERMGLRAEALAFWREARDLYAAIKLQEGVEEAESRMQARE